MDREDTGVDRGTIDSTGRSKPDGVGVLNTERGEVVLPGPLHGTGSVFEADAVAQRALRGVLDKQGLPLIYHARRVALKCREWKADTNVVIGALLHDVVEDAGEGSRDLRHVFDLGYVRSRFGEDVGRVVGAVTRYKGEMTYQQYAMEIPGRGGEDAVTVKLADLQDNLDEGRGPIPEELRERYVWARGHLVKFAPVEIQKIHLTC